MKRVGILARCALVASVSLAVGMSGCKKKDEDEEQAAEPDKEQLDPAVVAELEAEEIQLAKIRKGPKSFVYKRSRKGLVKAALALLGAVEGNADHPLLEKLPADIRTAIKATDGDVERMRALAENPTPELRLVIGTGYLVHLQKTGALHELELIDENSFKTPTAQSAYYVARGATYFMHGLKQHGLRDMRAANLGSSSDLDPEIRKAIYFGAAAMAIALDEPRMARSQLEMAGELSPDAPMITFLQAEREISKERFDEALEMLEGWRAENPEAVGVVAEAIDQRIAELRDSEETIKTVLTNREWVINFGLDYISEKAETSEDFRKLEDITETARTMGDEMLGRIGL